MKHYIATYDTPHGLADAIVKADTIEQANEEAQAMAKDIDSIVVSVKESEDG